MVEAIYRTFGKDVLVDGQISHALLSPDTLLNIYIKQRYFTSSMCLITDFNSIDGNSL